MTSPRPFKYVCDDCDRSIGDIGAFLWYHFEPDEDYCPTCFEKLPEEKKLLNGAYARRQREKIKGIDTHNLTITELPESGEDKLPEYLR